MLWLLFSIGTALFDAAKAAWLKRCLKDMDDAVLAWCSRAGALAVMSPLFFFTEIPLDNSEFLTAVGISGVINSITTILFVVVIRQTDLSIAMPMKAFAPLFLLLTSPLMIGEFPGTMGLIGVLLIVSGSYFLDAGKNEVGVLAPLRSLFRAKGPRLMLLVTFLWSIASNINKIGILSSSPIAFLLAMHVFMAVALFPFMLFKAPRFLEQIRPNAYSLTVLAILSALIPFCQWSALELTLVVYVLSIKRLSGVFGVLLGHFFYGERFVTRRLSAACLMLLGVLCISLFD